MEKNKLNNNNKKNSNKNIINKNIKNNKKLGGNEEEEEKTCCDDIEIEINIGAALRVLVWLFFWPINGLIWVTCHAIKLLLNHWNRNINALSLILERFINLIVFSLNGFLTHINFYLEEMKILLRFQLLVLKYNPFIYFSALTLPFLIELARFFADTFSINIITKIFSDGDWSMLNNFKNAVLNLVLGKTVKPKCNINNYVSKEEMKNHCYEYRLDSCNLNIATLWNIALYIIVILYISAWLNFLKLFYVDSSNFDLVDYTFLKLGWIDENFVEDFKKKV